MRLFSQTKKPFPQIFRSFSLFLVNAGCTKEKQRHLPHFTTAKIANFEYVYPANALNTNTFLLIKKNILTFSARIFLKLNFIH